MSACYKNSECGSTERIDITTVPLSTWLVGKKSTVRGVVNAAPDGSYFLLPAYLKRGVLSDWQPQISGKAKVCEAESSTMGSGSLLAAQREILEEIGFAFPLTAIAYHGGETDNGSTVNFFSVMMTSRVVGAADTTIRASCTTRAGDADERRMRISAHVVFTGTEAELITTLAERRRIASSDTGGSVIFAVPKATLLSYLV
jgi:predicted NUDIX family NTP pyrophosphohydrolase